MKPCMKLSQNRFIWCWPAWVNMVGGLFWSLKAFMLELMSSIMSGCVLSSCSMELRFFMSESHHDCNDCCGHCRICAVKFIAALGQAANSLCLVCIIFFPICRILLQTLMSIIFGWLSCLPLLLLCCLSLLGQGQYVETSFFAPVFSCLLAAYVFK